MFKDYNILDNRTIEDSILQVKDSMNRLQRTIQNSSAYSFKDIHFNTNYNILNDSNLNNSKINDYKSSKVSLNNYLDNSKKINFKRNKYETLKQKPVNNSYMTDIGKDFNHRNSNNNNYMLSSFNTESNFIQNQPKKISQIYKNYNTKYINNTYNNKIKLNNTKNTIISKNYNTKNIYLSNIYKPKKAKNKILSSIPSNTNSNTISYNTKSKNATYETKTEPNISNLKKKQNLKNAKNLDDLYKYGEYLSQELKISNDTNSELLENYISLSSQLQNKNKENSVINNKIKKLKEEDLKLNKAHEELKKNYKNAQNIIEKNNLSIKKYIIEAQKKN